MDAVRKKVYAALCADHSVFPCEFCVSDDTLALFSSVWLKDNPFLNAYVPVMWEVRRRAARTRFVLGRALTSYVRKRKTPVNELDLDMAPVGSIPASRRFEVYECGRRYTFSLTNALRVVMTAITTNVEMISSPVTPVNPYTRRPFRAGTIYRLFVALKNSPMTMPPLFYGFVKCHCELTRFVVFNECALRDYNTAMWVDGMSNSDAANEVRHMFAEVRAFHRASSIMPNWDLMPSKVLLKFKPWLYLYTSYCYTLNPYLRAAIYARLVQSMLLFLSQNPKFGTKNNNNIVCTDIDVAVRRAFV